MGIRKKKEIKPFSDDEEGLFDDGLDDFDIDSDKDDDYDDETYDDFDTRYDDNAKIQKLWLDSDPYVNKIYLIITNQEIIKKNIQTKNGWQTKQMLRQIEGTTPLANKEGISQIMGYVKAIFAGDIIQGNIDKVSYNKIMEYHYKGFMKFLLDSRLEWEMSVISVKRIHFLIIEPLALYITRPIGDAERRSSRNRNDLKPDKKHGFMDKIVNKVRNNEGRA